jgi:thiol:disulfide interchange protein DsbD
MDMGCNWARSANDLRWRRLFPVLGLVLAVLGLACPGAGAGAGQALDSRGKVAVTAVAQTTRVRPGQDVPVAVVFDQADGWHIHTHAPKVPPELGDPSFYIATQIRAQGAGDAQKTLAIHRDHIQWPTVHTIQVKFLKTPVDYGVFMGQAVAYLPVTVSADAAPGPVTLDILVTYQACDEQSCLAPVFDQKVSVTLEVLPLTIFPSPEPDADLQASSVPLDDAGSLFAGFDPAVWAVLHSGVRFAVVDFDLFGYQWKINTATVGGMAALLLLSLLGGFLLNLTPCVLPVIPIKILSLAQQAGSRGRTLAQGLVMSAGVVAFWLALGLAIAGLSGLSATNELFQKPWFTLSVGIFIAVMAVGMCGLFGLRLPRWVYLVNPSHESLGGSFLFGVMTAVLSTPCTAPFMGASLGWAVTQPPAMALLVFGVIGLGMALPYLVLSAFPKLVERVPRTGPGSELVKQVMGLLMLAAAAFFIGAGLAGMTFHRAAVDPPSKLYWWAVGGCVSAAGAWLTWRTWRIAKRLPPRVVFMGMGAGLIAAGIWIGIRFTDQGPIDWRYYTPERLAAALSAGKPVVVDFTAEWCLNCKVLEQNILYDARVTALFARGDAIAMKVDLTGENAVGNELLIRTGRRTIPWLVIFNPDGSVRFQSDAYTVGQVVDAVAGSVR